MSRFYVGIDSTTFYRGRQKAFRAPLGAAVVVNDYAEFDSRYTKVVSDLKSKYGVDSSRVCVKGHFISSRIGSDGARRFVGEFLEKILPSLDMVCMHHVMLSPTKLPEISFTGGWKEPTMKFMDTLTSSFNHLVAWNLLYTFPELKESHIFEDYFTGMATRAWEEMEGNKNLFVLPAGEYCNSLVSTADMMCKYVGDYLFANRGRFGLDGIFKAFGAKGISGERLDVRNDLILDVPSGGTKLYQTNSCPLGMVTPSSGRSMDVDSHMKHPVTFVLPSHRLKKEKAIMEHTPLFDLLVNDAHGSSGCVRFIDLDNLQNEILHMHDGDKIVTIGEKAAGDARYLQEFGVDVEVTPSNELVKKITT